MSVVLPGTGVGVASVTDANGEDPGKEVQLVRTPRGSIKPTRTRPDMSAGASAVLAAAGAKRALDITNESLTDELLCTWVDAATDTVYDFVIPAGSTWRSRPEDPVALALNGLLGNGGANAPANVSVYP